jgi:hypothetical protein
MNGDYGEGLLAFQRLFEVLPTITELIVAALFFGAVWLVSGCRA